MTHRPEAGRAARGLALAFFAACADPKPDAEDPHPFVRVAVTNRFNCALDLEGLVHCWGDLSDWSAPLPESAVRGLSCGSLHCCALFAETNEPICWGWDGDGEIADVSYSRQYTSLSAGSWTTCASRTDGHTNCWGFTVDSPEPETPEGLVTVVAGGPGACGLQADGHARCWRDWRYMDYAVPEVALVDLDMINSSVAGLDADGVPYFWPGEWQRSSAYPEGMRFRKLAIGQGLGTDDEAGCGITPEQGLFCWGNGPDGRQSPPALEGPVIDVDLGLHHGCALTEDGAVTCWGADPDGLGILEPPP